MQEFFYSIFSVSWTVTPQKEVVRGIWIMIHIIHPWVYLLKQKRSPCDSLGPQEWACDIGRCSCAIQMKRDFCEISKLLFVISVEYFTFLNANKLLISCWHHKRGQTCYRTAFSGNFEVIRPNKEVVREIWDFMHEAHEKLYLSVP